MSRRVLYIAYAYPPIGGAGVQRTTKFVKYLPQFGWLPSVLTVANPSVPLLDRSLSADIPAATLVRRARTWEPGYALKAAVAADKEGTGRRTRSVLDVIKGLTRRLTTALLQPDPQILWLPTAVRAGKRMLREQQHDAIAVSGPPFSSFLVGAVLSRWSGLPLILDYRDEWGISNTFWENKRLGRLSHHLQTRMQRRVVRDAHALVATTRSSAASLEGVRNRAGSKARVTYIYNGFDPDDFSTPLPSPAGEQRVYRLAYVGTLWNLTNVAPLVEAVLELGRHYPVLAERLELVFAGRRTPGQQKLLEPLQDSPCRLVQHSYLDHDTALGLIRNADGLCILLTDSPGAERVVPAKLFEYTAARRPILGICPQGEVWDILRTYSAAHLCLPSDRPGIVRYFVGEIQRHLGGQSVEVGSAWDDAPYSRRSQAGQLAELLASLTS